MRLPLKAVFCLAMVAWWVIDWLLFYPTAMVFPDWLQQAAPYPLVDLLVVAANCAFWAAVITFAVALVRRARAG